MQNQITRLLFFALFTFINGVFALLSAVDAKAQVPLLFNYQGIARDARGNVLNNQKMSLKLSILPAADATVAEYAETQYVTTNEFGLYTLQIGNGAVLNGEMKNVKWETGNKYIQVAIDPGGGNNYVDAGTKQLLSVPYAIYADKAGNTANYGNNKTRTGAVNSNAAHIAGDINYLSKFTAFNNIGKSLIFENGTNIGIGTVTPTARFQISQNLAAVQEHMRMQNYAGTGAGRFTMYNDVSASYATFTKYGTTYTGGYTGIVSKYPYGNLLAFGNNGMLAGDGKGRFLISSAGNIGISIAKGGTSKLKFHADYISENVSIGGNADPVYRVHLNNTDSTDMTIGITNNTTGHSAADGLVIRENGNIVSIINKESSSLSLGTNNVTVVNMTAAGNTELSGQIKIAGGSPGAGKILVSDSTGLATWQAGPVGPAGPPGPIGVQGPVGFLPNGGAIGNTPYWDGINWIDSSNIFNDGNNIGLGTVTPSQKLEVIGNIKAESLFTTNNLANRKIVINEAYNNDSEFFGFGVNPWILRYQVPSILSNHVFYSASNGAISNELMRIQGTGNVGIGVPAPIEKLEVWGNIKADALIGLGLQITPNAGAGKVMMSDANGNGSWQPANPVYSIGLNNAMGGFIFSVTPDGKHGLVCATQDQGFAPWWEAQDLISDPANHNIYGQQFRNWRLPTQYELNLLQSYFIVIGGFALPYYYWSNKLLDATHSLGRRFSDGATYSINNDDPWPFRAVRSF